MLFCVYGFLFSQVFSIFTYSYYSIEVAFLKCELQQTSTRISYHVPVHVVDCTHVPFAVINDTISKASIGKWCNNILLIVKTLYNTLYYKKSCCKTLFSNRSNRKSMGVFFEMLDWSLKSH